MPLCIVNIPLIYWSVCSYNVTSSSILLLIWYNKDIEDIDGATIFSRCDFTSTSTQKRILTVLPSSGADVIMRYIKTIMECKKRRKILNGNTSLYKHVEYLCYSYHLLSICDMSPQFQVLSRGKICQMLKISSQCEKKKTSKSISIWPPPWKEMK